MAAHLPLNQLQDLSLKAINLKCFRELQGFETIKPVNVIIGKNNVGKSSLLDLIDYAVSGQLVINPSVLTSGDPEILLSCRMDNAFMDAYCREVGQTTHNEFANLLQDANITLALHSRNTEKFFAETLESVKHRFSSNPQHAIQTLQRITSKMGNPFDRSHFRRIAADRDIRHEGVGNPDGTLQNLGANGEHATTLIHRYLHQEDLDLSIVEETITSELNEIFRPDAKFDRILTRQRRSREWEIYLEEPRKGLIPMSQTGSGIKTVLLVLLNLFLVPDVLGREQPQKSKLLSNFLFGFEELENNLHPSIQRRLFRYLSSVSNKEGCTFFITTHSHVVVDLFSRDENAQIIHITHDGERAEAKRVTTYINHRSIFDDLEVRASDLLQTNAVVWVEGPSDRTYFNKWIELWTDGEIKEHVDYEVVFTAGTLLAHFGYDEPDTEKALIQGLNINQHAIVLMDSDRKQSKDQELKPNVARVVTEVESMGGLAWITAGKEVENYIPQEALAALSVPSEELPESQFDNMLDFIKRHTDKDFSSKKPALAEQVCNVLNKEMLTGHLDLAERLDEVCEKLRLWNNRGRTSFRPLESIKTA